METNLIELRRGYKTTRLQGYRIQDTGLKNVKRGYMEPSLQDTNRDVNVFIFQKNDRFVMKTTTKNRKRNDRFLKRLFL